MNMKKSSPIWFKISQYSVFYDMFYKELFLQNECKIMEIWIKYLYVKITEIVWVMSIFQFFFHVFCIHVFFEKLFKIMYKWMNEWNLNMLKYLYL